MEMSGVRRVTGWARAEARAWWDEPLKAVALRASVVRPYRTIRFRSFGPHSIIDRPTWVYGPQQISVGTGVVALRGIWLAVERPAWEREGPVLTIGDRVWFRPYCTVSASTSVVIEDDVVVSAFSLVIDSDHTYSGGQVNVLHNPVTSSPVHIGRGTWIGERVAILRGSTIGEGCVIGTNSVVRGDIPDHSIAVGAPARVIGTTG
jgi:acetyltransferase-like isoleucine patch superfamily enzyme